MVTGLDFSSVRLLSLYVSIPSSVSHLVCRRHLGSVEVSEERASRQTWCRANTTAGSAVTTPGVALFGGKCVRHVSFVLVFSHLIMILIEVV